MPFDKKYTLDFKKQVVLELQSGELNHSQLAEMYDLASSSVTYWKYEMVRKYPIQFKTLRDELVIKLYKKGETLEFIHKKIGIPTGSVHNILRENKIDFRRKVRTSGIVHVKTPKLSSQILVENVSTVNQDYNTLQSEYSELQQKYNDLRAKFGELMLKSQGL